MDIVELIFAIVQAVIPGVIVGIVMGIWTRRHNRQIKAAEDREASAKEKETIKLSLLVATAELSYAMVMAMKRGSPNGEVETALKSYNNAMRKFREFERKTLGYLD